MSVKNYYPLLPILPYQKTSVKMDEGGNVGIYKVTSPTGKVYIGQSWELKKRNWYYKSKNCKSQTILYRSLIKYGSENHLFELVHELPIDCPQDVMNNYEQLYMDCYKSAGVLLLNARGAGSRGKFSEESKRKMSEAASKKVVTKEAIERLRFYARNRTAESRLKVSESLKGNKYRLGIPHDAKSLKKISAASCLYKYVIKDQFGNIDVTTNLGSFCKENNLTTQLLGHTFRGHYANGDVCNHHKGYKIISKEKLVK